MQAVSLEDEQASDDRVVRIALRDVYEVKSIKLGNKLWGKKG